MKIALPLLTALCCSVLLVALAGCGQDDTGIPCKAQLAAPDPNAPASEQAPQITTNALDCRSRLCLAVGSTKDPLVRPLCTKLCDSDDDCPDNGDACPKGERFVCKVTVQTQALACCKMCVCAYFVAGSTSSSSACANITPNCPTL